MLQLTRPVLSQSHAKQSQWVILGIAASGLLLSPFKHRLHWRVCNFLGKRIRDKGMQCTIALNDDSQMQIFLDDPYWARLISKSYRYEVDFERVLLQLKDIPFVFLDCGANFGYWSILLSSETFGKHSTAAVEASPTTYQLLKKNCELNQNRFQHFHYAISSENGHQVSIESPSGHAGAHISLQHPSDTNKALVSTITLDQVADQAFPSFQGKILIKLDVEGQEINALKGAKKLLEQDVLFYYEDHGNDPSSAVTEFILNTLNLNVFFFSDSGTFLEIHSAEEASRQKKQTSYGYNFFACKKNSGFHQALTSLKTIAVNH